MPKKTTKKSTPVEAMVHKDKRTNIPTQELRGFVKADEPKKMLYPRDPSLDPQLVWKGKDEQDSEPLEVPVVPIYIQEKVHSKAIIENLRKTAKEGQPEPEMTLFDDFNGIEFNELVDFYEHEQNWANRMILGDSLSVMSSLAEKEHLKGKVQMIYLDPPYGIKFGSNWQVSTRKRDVKDGKVEDATRQPEQVKAFRDTWELGIHSYLAYLRDRLVVARDLLTESGSVFVQIGDENMHLVRSLLDEVFGSENFIHVITFKKTSGASGNELAGVTDYILWYAHTKGRMKFRSLYFDKLVGSQGSAQYRWVEEPDGTRRRATSAEVQDPPPELRFFRPDNLVSQRPAQGGDLTAFDFEGQVYSPGTGTFKTDKNGLEALARAHRLMPTGKTLSYVRFIDDFPAIPLVNLWEDTATGGFTDPKVYVVQTNTKVTQRCLLMTTDPGDLVLDPTCGSGTTAVVAELWGRRWIAVDTSRVALALARTRLMAARYPYYLLTDSLEGSQKQSQIDGAVPAQNSFDNDIRRGFVYKTVPHITLKSIANNRDVKEGMPRHAINEAIARHADQEMLYDQPYEDKGRLRVTGPFTVESLSPHRSMDATAEERPATEHQADVAEDAGRFEEMIIDNFARLACRTPRRARS